tara:strand:- start:177 stop:473 length:297 start_codon:yes stop_codon:yes gene_type:complete
MAEGELYFNAFTLFNPLNPATFTPGMAKPTPTTIEKPHMFGLFKRDPTKKLAKQIAQKRAEAVQFQRSGDLRTYGAMMKEIEQLEDELIRIRDGSSDS